MQKDEDKTGGGKEDQKGNGPAAGERKKTAGDGAKTSGNAGSQGRPRAATTGGQKHKKKKKPALPPTTWERTFLRAITGLSWMDEPNHLFYTARLQSVPDGDWIDDIHIKWFWDYDHLEAHHGYIQWLFPIFEGQGMNFGSYRLLKEEAKKMRKNFDCNVRFLRSYKLMLNFYGFRIVDHKTGELERTEEWEDRFLNLNYCSHNNLRISRILMALGEHGFVRYKRTLLAKLREEIKDNGQMPECTESLEKFWTFLVEREDTPDYVKKTKESPEDKEEAVFFKHLAAEDKVYKKWEEDEKLWWEKLVEYRESIREKFEESRERRAKDFKRREQLYADMERSRAQARANKEKAKGQTKTKNTKQQSSDGGEDEVSDHDSDIKGKTKPKATDKQSDRAASKNETQEVRSDQEEQSNHESKEDEKEEEEGEQDVSSSSSSDENEDAAA